MDSHSFVYNPTATNPLITAEAFLQLPNPQSFGATIAKARVPVDACF